ncbi:hypothetical protein O6H91_12G022700 [Diphasiastrum complanatum]|uniref:Uncharacterized protein n=1 Tax=Diphasiastrum complanatum TaxID=34168 RepID=A0ACC2BZL1_DIPCM|nr:hypothetical protein O6H91_12G022700 [Diphasiastrum complanatum]
MATWSAHRSIPPDLRLWMIFEPLVFPRARLHSFSNKERGGRQVQAQVGKGEDVRLPLMDPCCIIPPLALSRGRGSMGLKPKRARSDRKMVSADAEVAELVARVVNDPMVEVDPVTLGLHLSKANKGVATSTNLSNSVATSTRLPPFSLNSRGLNALAYSAAGASFVMVIAAVVQSLRSHARNHSNSAVSGHAESFSFNSAREAYAQELVSNEDLPSYTDRTVLTDNPMSEAQVPNYAASYAHAFPTDEILGENLQVANTKTADHLSSRNSVQGSSLVAEGAQLIAEEQDFRIETAPKSDGKGSALQPPPGNDPHTPHNSNKSEAPLPAFLSLGSTHKFDPCEDNLHAAADKRKLDARKALKAAAPALAIGAGALGIFAGIDGGLEMVGMAAAASFISYELLWAQTREQLWQEMRRVTDHEKLMHFLKARKILQDL